MLLEAATRVCGLELLVYEGSQVPRQATACALDAISFNAAGDIARFRTYRLIGGLQLLVYSALRIKCGRRLLSCLRP